MLIQSYKSSGEAWKKNLHFPHEQCSVPNFGKTNRLLLYKCLNGTSVTIYKLCNKTFKHSKI